MTRVLLETTASLRAGRDRGIGRYLSAVRAANAELGNACTEISDTMGHGRLSEFMSLPRRQLKLRRMDYDVFHAPTPYYAGWPGRRHGNAVSVLDIIPLDVAGHSRTGTKAAFFYRLAARADAVLTISHHAAGRIAQRLGVDPARIVVAPLPVAAEFTADGPGWSGGPSRYAAALVDLRTTDPRKRAQWLVDVAAQLKKVGVDLVVAGSGTEGDGLEGTIGLGRIDDATWAAVLRGAELLVYTSAYEGQGMPPLEAISCGTPVVAMGNTAIPEVVGGAGVLVDEGEDERDAVRRLGQACVDLLGDEEQRARLLAACLPQAQLFGAKRFADSLAEAYDLAASRR